MDVAKFYRVEFKKKAWKYSLLKSGVKRVDSPFSECIVLRADKFDPSDRLWEAAIAAKAAVGISESVLQRWGFQLIMIVNDGVRVGESSSISVDNAEPAYRASLAIGKISDSIQKVSSVQDFFWISCGRASDDLTAALELCLRNKVNLEHHWVHCYQPRSSLLPLVNMADSMNYFMGHFLAHTKVPNVLGSIHRLAAIFYRLKFDGCYRKEYAMKDMKLHVSAVINSFISVYFLLFVGSYLAGLNVLLYCVTGAAASVFAVLTTQFFAGYYHYRKGVSDRDAVAVSDVTKV